MQEFKVTIITVVYNDKIGIEKTVKSVLSQTYENIEYIIVDGASTDGTLNVINNYKSHIDMLISESDKGIYDAMNKGITHAHGDLINFMNAGDVFLNSEIVSQLVKAYKNEDVIYGNIIRLYGNYQVRAKGITTYPPQIIDFLYNTFHHQASFINKRLFNKYGLYSTNLKLASDWKFFFEIAILHHATCKHVNLDICLFQMDGASTVNSLQYAEERKKVLQGIYGYELYSYIDELYTYRNIAICRLIYRLRCLIKDKFSASFREKIRKDCRVIRTIFHMNDNNKD